MEFQQAVDELQHNLEQIEKLCRHKRLRRILKFLLIGFLIWRDSDRKISELVAKNKLIIENVLQSVKGLGDVSRQIREFADASARLSAMDEKMKELAGLENLAPDIENWAKKRREIIAEFVRKAVEQREHDIETRVEKTERSGTYLIYSEKQRHLDAIRSFEEDLDYCGQRARALF